MYFYTTKIELSCYPRYDSVQTIGFQAYSHSRIVALSCYVPAMFLLCSCYDSAMFCNCGEYRLECSRLQTGKGGGRQGETREQAGSYPALNDLAPIRKTPCAYTQNTLRLYAKSPRLNAKTNGIFPRLSLRQAARMPTWKRPEGDSSCFPRA